MCWQLYACVCPPCSVAAKRGCGGDCCINLCLTILGYLPGCVHACFVVSSDNSQHSTTTTVVIKQPQATTMVSLPAPVTAPPHGMGYPNPLYPNGYAYGGQGDAPPMYTSPPSSKLNDVL